MYCNHCGKINEDDAKICASCGQEIQRTEDAIVPNQIKAKPTVNVNDIGNKISELGKKVDTEKIKEKFNNADKKKLVAYGGIAVGALALIIAVIVIISSFTSKVSLKKYMADELNYTGINGYGTADISDLIDYSSLNQVVLKKNLSSKDYDEYYYYGDYDIRDYVSYECVSENNGKLSNGDSVEILVTVNKDGIKNNKLFGKSISGGEKQSFKYKVEGLTEGTAIDIFDAVDSVTVDTTSYNQTQIKIKDNYVKQYGTDGINVKEENGNIRVYGDNFNSFTVYLSIASDNFDENSKTAKVKVNCQPDQYKDYGIVFAKTEAEVKVNSISYVRYNTISKDDLTKLTNKVNDLAKERLDNGAYTIVKAAVYFDTKNMDNSLAYFIKSGNKIYMIYYNYLKQYSDGKIVNVDDITPASYMTFVSYKSVEDAEKNGMIYTEKVDIPLTK